jgi:ABC-type glycerol-3-phosphate transport system substrate-binding protein
MNGFKQVAKGSNTWDEAIALAERINEDGGTDVLSVVDGMEFGEEGFIVTIEYYNGRKPNEEKVFETKAEAVDYFNTLIG